MRTTKRTSNIHDMSTPAVSLYPIIHVDSFLVLVTFVLISTTGFADETKSQVVWVEDEMIFGPTLDNAL